LHLVENEDERAIVRRFGDVAEQLLEQAILAARRVAPALGPERRKKLLELPPLLLGGVGQTLQTLEYAGPDGVRLRQAAKRR
jgi:hypothetical protein